MFILMLMLVYHYRQDQRFDSLVEQYRRENDSSDKGMLAWVADKLGRPVSVVQKRWVMVMRPLPEGMKPRTAEWTEEDVRQLVRCLHDRSKKQARL
jgi:hypothetical protein